MRVTADCSRRKRPMRTGQAGDHVVATARNLDKVRNAWRDVTGENLAIVQLDLADEAQSRAAIEKAVKPFGRIGGRNGPGRPFTAIPRIIWETAW